MTTTNQHEPCFFDDLNTLNRLNSEKAERLDDYRKQLAARDARIAELVRLLQFLLDSGVLDGVEIDDVDPKKAIRAALV